MPATIDLLIEARWVAPVLPDDVLHHYGIAIRDGRIVALLPAAQALERFEPRQHIVLKNHIVIPGLVNLHTHGAMSLMRGFADDLPLMEWLQTRVWPTEAAHVSHGFVKDGTRLACAEMLRGGITCFNDMYFFPDAAAEAVNEMGLRAVLGITTLEFPTAFASDPDDYIAKGLAARDRWLEHPRISFCLAPHSPYTVSNATFERIQTLSARLDLPIHCHVHETQAELAESLEKFGIRPLERLSRLELLGPSFIGVHAVHLLPEEIDRLARQGCSIAHCPSSNLKLGSGIAPVASLLEAGVNVGLGTDGAASNNRLDLFQEMRQAALLAKGSTGNAAVLPARQALRMATLNGALALGLDEQIGSITPGKLADLVAVELSALEVSPCFDPVSHLIYAAGREHVSHVWIGGTPLMEAGQLHFSQEKELKNSVSLWQNKVASR